MNCRELDSFMLPYLDGELESEARADIESHLAGCTACATYLHQEAGFHQGFKARLREALSDQHASEGLRSRIQGGIRAEQRRHLTVRWVRVGAAAAAVVVVAAGSGYELHLYKNQNEKQNAFASAARSHARVRLLPQDIQDPAPGMTGQWLATQLEHGVRLPHFDNAVMKGARYSNVGDKPAGYVVYDVPGTAGDNRRVGLFVFDDSSRESPAEPYPAVQVANAQGYNVALWRENDTVYELVSDLDESDIRAMVRAKSNREPVAFDIPASFPTAHPAFQAVNASFQQ